VGDNNREQLRALGEERRRQQNEAKAKGDTRAPMISSHEG